MGWKRRRTRSVAVAVGMRRRKRSKLSVLGIVVVVVGSSTVRIVGFLVDFLCFGGEESESSCLFAFLLLHLSIVDVLSVADCRQREKSRENERDEISEEA